MSTPVRGLEGISYWVIDDPDAIYDFVNSEVRREWEADARSEHRDLKDDPWLRTLARRKWHLKMMDITRIKLDPHIMNYVDPETGYMFSKSLEKRSAELQHNIELGAVVLSPLIIPKEDTQLVDGYCRYTTLRAMSVSRTYICRKPLTRAREHSLLTVGTNINPLSAYYWFLQYVEKDKNEQ